MSLPKAQLVDPQGNMNLPGMTATGIVTASSLKGVTTGSATGLTGNPDLDVGIVTASSFVGQGDGHAANLTGTPQLNLGVTTSTGFVGDAVGKAAGLTGTPNLNVGLITATSFVGFVTGDVTGNITGDVTGNITGNIQGDVEGNVTGNVSGLARGLGINGLNVWTGAGTSNLGVGVCTAIELYGDGSNLTGAGSSAYIAQEITATGAETIIDLSYGNLIYLTQDGSGAQTTVGFASTSPAEQLTIIRNPDTSSTINWNISYSTGGVDFDGSDALTAATSSDYSFGTGDYTIEFWFNADAISDTPLFENRVSGAAGDTTGFTLTAHGAGEGTNGVRIWWTGASRINGGGASLSTGSWFHLAATRSSGTTYLFLDGTLLGTTTDSIDVTSTEAHIAGGKYGGSTGLSHYFDGKISNFRLIKGTCLYTEDFTPPSSALTNVTNTKLLCCQSDSSATAATVIATGSITATGDPTAGAQTITNTGSRATGTYTITWPSTVKWNGNTTPTLISNSYSGAFQIFHLTTVDTGLNYNAWEEMKDDSLGGQYQLWTWGMNQSGELGQNQSGPFPSATAWYSSPVQLGTETKWSQANGPGGITFDKKLWVMGNNFNGQLGQNDITQRSSPTQVSGTTWTSSMPGRSLTMMTKSDNTLWSVGSNGYGSLGLNQPTSTHQSSPCQVGGSWGTDPNKMATGYNSNGAIQTNGTLWMWGSNSDGAQGQNNRTAYSSPKQVGSDSTWRSVSKNMFTSTATKTDGTLWSWGRNQKGELGLNESGSPMYKSSPTQVGTDTTWSDSVPMGGWYTNVAIKTDGTLWCWGSNGNGGLGQNQAEAQLAGLSSPTQVPGTTWSKITAGDDGAHLAIKTDGTFWVWGRNSGGVLGLNSEVAMSSPVQIPGTNWISVRTNDNVVRALKSS